MRVDHEISTDILFTFNNPELIPDPYPIYQAMRLDAPAHLLPLYDGSWIFLDYHDVRQLLRDSRLSNDRSELPLRALPPEQRREYPEMTAIMRRWVGMQDQPAHLPMRRHLNHVTEHLDAARLRSVAQSYIDQLVAQLDTGTEVDVIGELAYRLPALVISDLLGLPVTDYLRLAQLADELAYVFGSSQLTAADVDAASSSATNLVDYLAAQANRPGLPDDSLLYRMLHTRTDQYQFTPAQAYAQCVLLLFAGLEPTRYAIGNAIHALATHPEQTAALRADPRLLPSGVEELLRYDSPVQWVGRKATESFDFHGHRIERGQLVFPFVGAANRDPKRFANPDTLDVGRTGNQHLSFGHGGHHCLGAALVRVQLQVTLSELLHRFSGFRLSESTDIRWNSNVSFHGHQFLPVTFLA
ncbi:hypothetical protein EV191_101842 [Tamaricihabitans halophyticus]|uniref:Cytochrome P450 n=1 Tax=Tamaricihabitans halophyticus TaxID=1262583 RepID=A0A4R2R2W1_9PSEU|nr:cytochrome P450 [Tamaricihabitans halophyticus]TCP56893.1 hypothetical protein EV191_101842 [Tamaricihabitans halophyticus]